MDNLMVVLSNAKPTLEDEFNEWYSDVHVIEVVDNLDGFEAAQRFTLAPGQVEDGADYKYLAIYRIPNDKLEDAQNAIRSQRAEREEALAAGRAPMISNRKDLFDGAHRTWFFTPLGEAYVPSDEESNY